MKFSRKVRNGLMNKRLNFGGDPRHCLDTVIVFRIGHYWEIRKVVSTDCAARRCSAQHALACITVATMTSLRHRLLAEVCTVPVLLVIFIPCERLSWLSFSKLAHIECRPMVSPHRISSYRPPRRNRL